MRTIQTARTILTSRPKEAMADAVGLAVVAVLIFAGFLAPAVV
ncbi:MAG: hypothetical protein AAGJ28_16935 [Pseudomonadota bacterium]